jgi:hypothetical protein
MKRPSGNILFFSRGRGRGHALPDSALATSLKRIDPTLSIQFVSYAVGAKTLQAKGWPVIDLGLPERGPMWDVVASTAALLRNSNAGFVISHEEMAVLPISRAFGLPNLFMSDWLPKIGSRAMQSLSFADSVILLDEPGYYELPDFLANKISYAGTLLQPMACCQTDRKLLRVPLNVSKDHKLITVVPGGSDLHSEARAPIATLVLQAFSQLPMTPTALVWVVDEPDFSRLGNLATAYPNVTVRKPDDKPLQLMRASDLVLTKGNRMTVLECYALGIPSISLSYGINRIDDYRIARVRSNIAFRVLGLDAVTLTRAMTDALRGGLQVPRYAEIGEEQTRRVSNLILSRF